MDEIKHLDLPCFLEVNFFFFSANISHFKSSFWFDKRFSTMGKWMMIRFKMVKGLIFLVKFGESYSGERYGEKLPKG
jgi:hypothetical protein